MIGFRPLPGMSVATLAALGVLVALGVWQLERAQEKRDLIAERARLANEGAFPDLYTPLCALRASPAGRLVEPPATRAGEEVRFYGGRADGAPGWLLLRLAPAPDCDCPQAAACAPAERFVVVESGFETLDGERTGPPARIAFARPPRPNAFTPKNDPARGDFYRFELDSLASAFGVPADRIDARWWLVEYVPGLPPEVRNMPPSRHMGYAATWFGLAVVLVGVYLAYHVRAGRIRL